MKAGFVAIVGRPNVGKSTLLNRILGVDLAIVTPKAQTTRDHLFGVHNEKASELLPQGGQIVFVDTPGLHQARQGGINEYMVREARRSLESVSAVWYLVDPMSHLHHEKLVFDVLLQAKLAETPIFLVINKVDVRRPGGLTSDTVREWAQGAGIAIDQMHEISARKGSGVANLLAETWKRIPEGQPHFEVGEDESLSDRPLRYFVGEKIREQLLLQLGDEIPYSCAVDIKKYEDQPPGDKLKARIEAVILVERESQKGMVIGKGGKKIQAIGSGARTTIEELVGGHVFLGLQVKVQADWSRDSAQLRRLGYHS